MVKSITLSDEYAKAAKRIKAGLVLFIIGLVLSGLTAFPLEAEITLLCRWMETMHCDNSLSQWLGRIQGGITETNRQYPFMAYGTDWLAFAHLMFALAFVGPLQDPVRNKWVVEFGLLACAAVLPTAWIAGQVRDIPFFWRLIDCSFGILGGTVLIVTLRNIYRLEILNGRT